MSKPSGACMSCFQFIDVIKSLVPAGLGAPECDMEEQAGFSALMGFLATVPLFRQQLSRSDLPLIARALVTKTWSPGEVLMRQGDDVHEFTLIKSGKAIVMAIDAEGANKKHDNVNANQVCAELTRGDYVGAYHLQHRVPCVATVCAAGPEPLVTLSLMREKFMRLGLHTKINVPKRRALFKGSSGLDLKVGNCPNTVPLDEAAQQVVTKSLEANECLRTLLGKESLDTAAIAQTARLKRVRKGDILARTGKLADHFVVVAEGSLEVVLVDDADQSTASVSAEALVGKKRRVARAQEARCRFLKSLHSQPKALRVRSDEDCPEPTLRHSQKTAGDAMCNAKSARYRNCATMMVFEMPRFKTGDQVRKVHKPGTSVGDLRSSLKGSLQSVGSLRSMGLTKSAGSFKAEMTEDDLSSASTMCSSSSQLSRSGLSLHAKGCGIGDSDEAYGVVVDDRVVDADSLRDGTIIVLFPGGKETCRVSELKKCDANLNYTAFYPQSPATTQCEVSLIKGDSFGEMSMLYNVPMMETIRASEDSQVYVVRRQDFKAGLVNESKSVAEFTALLHEVHMLSALLIGERQELARNVTGRLTFAPGESIMVQGQTPSFFIVERGCCAVLHSPASGKLEVLSTLVRGGHFGEWSLLHGQNAGLHVDAGVDGMTCIVFEGDVLVNLRLRDADDNIFGLPSLQLDPVAYERAKAVMLMKQSYLATRSAMEVLGAEVRKEALERVKMLGKGGFGSVTLELDRARGIHYALKRMSKTSVIQQGMQRWVAAERDIMSLVDSPFIIRFFRSFKDEKNVYFLMEAVLGGDLHTLRVHKPELFECSEPATACTAFYTACIALALDHLHQRSIIYRDLKPENVLLDDRGFAKICDMGFARFCFAKSNTFLGTPEYMAPEMIDAPHMHDRMVDWWALGVLAFELTSGSLPWDVEDTGDPMEMVLSYRRAQSKGPLEAWLPGDTPASARDCMRRLMAIVPARRMGHGGGIEELKAHAWFKSTQVNFEEVEERTMQSPFTPENNVPVKDMSGAPGDDDEGEAHECLASEFLSDADVEGEEAWDDAF